MGGLRPEQLIQSDVEVMPALPVDDLLVTRRILGDGKVVLMGIADLGAHRLV